MITTYPITCNRCYGTINGKSADSDRHECICVDGIVPPEYIPISKSFEKKKLTVEQLKINWNARK